MSFDITNDLHLQELQSEVNVDPIGMGYAALPSTDTKKLLEALNESSSNVGGETAGAIFNHATLLATWEPKGVLNEMLPWIESLVKDPGDISSYEAKYRADCGTLSLTALDAVTLPQSRAEVLWGQGTIITKDDWFAARDYQA